MKTYFKWQTPAGFRPKKSTESLKKGFKPMLFEALFSACMLGAILLLWFLLGIERGSLFADLFIIFAILAVVVFTMPILAFVCIPFMLWRPPKGETKVKLTENKVIFGKGRRDFWEYGDIQSFEVIQDQFQGMAIPVLELENFDGRGCSLGMSQEVSLKELESFLSERIRSAREITRNLNVAKGTLRQAQFGFLLLMFGMLVLLVSSVGFWKLRSIEKRSNKFEAELARRVSQLELQKAGKEQIELFEKVAEWSLSAELLVKRNNLLIVIFGSISIILLGGVSILWSKNIYLKNKICRLQAYLPDRLDKKGAEQKS